MSCCADPDPHNPHGSCKGVTPHPTCVAAASRPTSAFEIVVVTKVPGAGEESGNLAMAGFDLFWTTGEKGDDYLDKVIPLKDALAEMLGDPQGALGFIFNLRAPVFQVGEVLILNEWGREIGYPGRKPSKWSVETTTVASLEEAATLSQEVK